MDLIVWTSREAEIDHAFDSVEACRFDFVKAIAQSLNERTVYLYPAKSPLEGWETSCKYHCHRKEHPCYRAPVARYDSSLSEGSNLTIRCSTSESLKKRAATEQLENQVSKRQA